MTTPERGLEAPPSLAAGTLRIVALEPIRMELIATVEQSVVDGVRDADALAHIVRRTVGRWVDRTYRRRPMLMPMVIEV